MELIEQLEKSIIALTSELKAQRAEVVRLRAELEHSQTLVDLEAQLLHEKELRNEASKRIEKLLDIVRENLTEESE